VEEEAVAAEPRRIKTRIRKSSRSMFSNTPNDSLESLRKFLHLRILSLKLRKTRKRRRKLPPRSQSNQNKGLKGDHRSTLIA
jgi:hypothetical protein